MHSGSHAPHPGCCVQILDSSSGCSSTRFVWLGLRLAADNFLRITAKRFAYLAACVGGGTGGENFIASNAAKRGPCITHSHILARKSWPETLADI